MSKAPSLQFYPGDVQRDTALSSCSLAAFGLWHRMLWAMFDGEPFGHLSVNGSVIPPVNLARLLRVTEGELDTYLQELEAAGVFSRTPEGVIFCRRMVRDAKRRETNALNGSKGGNPRLSKESKSVNRKDKPKDNRQVIPLTADADSNTAEENTQGKERAGVLTHFTGAPFGSREAIEAWAGFVEMRKKKGKPMTDRARELIIKDLQKMGEADAILSMNASTRAGWTDVFPPKRDQPPARSSGASTAPMDRNAEIEMDLITPRRS